MRKKVVLHAGHGKTGSSYIQSFLAINKKKLLDYGVLYPDHPSLRKASQGKITSGNVSFDSLGGELDKISHDSDCRVTYLYSNEGLWGGILRRGAEIESYHESLDITVNVWIRDPLDHAVSSYIQEVKRGGYVGEFSDFIKNINMPKNLLRFIKVCGSKGWRVKTRNYSKHRRQLIGIFLEDLIEEFSIEDFEFPQSSVINRSLNNAEIYLQKEFNRHFGRASCRFISDPLCHDITELPPSLPACSQADLEEFSNRMNNHIDYVNDLLAFDESYDKVDQSSFGKFQESESDVFSFTNQQIEVIARSISKRISSLEAKVAEFENKQR